MTRHMRRNALIPIVTFTGIQLAYLLSGVVVVEVVFAWQGLGQLALQAVQSRDYPVVQGAVLLFAVFFLVINLIVDLLSASLDPRIRYRCPPSRPPAGAGGPSSPRGRPAARPCPASPGWAGSP